MPLSERIFKAVVYAIAGAGIANLGFDIGAWLL